MPAWASAKITCRLVPNQKPETIARLVSQHLRRICPASVKLTVTEGHHSHPFMESPSGRGARAGFANELQDRISLASGLPAVADMAGVIDAMHHSRLRTVAMATPFRQFINDW